MSAAVESHSILVNKAILYFLFPGWHAIVQRWQTWKAEEVKPVSLCACELIYVHLWKCVFTCYMCVWGVGWMSACGEKVVQPPPWLTSRLPSRTANPACPPPPIPPLPNPLTPAEANARFNTASTKQTQTPTVLLYVACRGCARRSVENPCLYRNHNTVDLQRDAPAHARTTQNITDHLLNTEIEPHCNVKVWGYRGLARPGKILCIPLNEYNTLTDELFALCDICWFVY